MTTIIKESQNYTLSIGKPVNSKEGDNDSVYQIKNKKYGVVEVETPMLPQAIKYIHDLEAGLAAVEDIFAEEEKETPILKLHTSRPRVN